MKASWKSTHKAFMRNVYITQDVNEKYSAEN